MIQISWIVAAQNYRDENAKLFSARLIQSRTSTWAVLVQLHFNILTALFDTAAPLYEKQLQSRHWSPFSSTLNTFTLSRKCQSAFCTDPYCLFWQ